MSAWEEIDASKLTFDGLDLTQPIVEPSPIPIVIEPRSKR